MAHSCNFHPYTEDTTFQIINLFRFHVKSDNTSLTYLTHATLSFLLQIINMKMTSLNPCEQTPTIIMPHTHIFCIRWIHSYSYIASHKGEFLYFLFCLFAIERWYIKHMEWLVVKHQILGSKLEDLQSSIVSLVLEYSWINLPASHLKPGWIPHEWYAKLWVYRRLNWINRLAQSYWGVFFFSSNTHRVCVLYIKEGYWGVLLRNLVKYIED